MGQKNGFEAFDIFEIPKEDEVSGYLLLYFSITYYREKSSTYQNRGDVSISNWQMTNEGKSQTKLTGISHFLDDNTYFKNQDFHVLYTPYWRRVRVFIQPSLLFITS